MRDILKAYYGESAAPHLWKMIRTLQKPGSADFHLHLYRHPHLGTFRPAQLRSAQAHLDKAVEAARNDDKSTQRLDHVALWMDFTRMATARPIGKRARALRIHAADKDAPERYKRVRRGIKKFRIKDICEFPRSMNDLKIAWGWSLEDRDLPLTILEDENTRVEITPELNGMICGLLDKKSGIDILCKPDPEILAYPYMAGTIEGVDLEKGTLGFREFDRWRLKAADATRAIMKLSLGRGLHVEREMALLSDEPGVRVRSVITSRSKTKQTLRPHCFLLFRAGELNDVHFFKRAADAALADLDNGMRAGTSMEQWVNLSGEQVPDRLWGFFNPKLKIGLSEEVNGKIEFCGSNGHLETGHVLTETRLKPVTLKTGGSTVFERTYRILHKKPL